MPPLRPVPRAISGPLLARSPWFPQALPPGSRFPMHQNDNPLHWGIPTPWGGLATGQTPPLMRGGCRPLALPAPDHLRDASPQPPARCVAQVPKTGAHPELEPRTIPGTFVLGKMHKIARRNDWNRSQGLRWPMNINFLRNVIFFQTFCPEQKFLG